MNYIESIVSRRDTHRAGGLGPKSRKEGVSHPHQQLIYQTSSFSLSPLTLVSFILRSNDSFG